MKRTAFLLLLPALAQASFLGDLAAGPNVVASSPYATGGDLILQLGASEYVHVFTNTAAAATFTPVSALRARVLVVAGGGAAGSVTQSPGGGGAGGMIEEKGVELAVGTDYTATVGAGGAATTSQNGNKNGDNSSFAGGSVSLTAIGGGRGSDYGANTAKSGGSGGGAGSNKTVTSGGAGTDGQGHDGGGVLASPYNEGGGGGGGAGAAGGTVMIYAGESPLGALHGGIGGDGLPSDILGFEQYFAGGGGGFYNKTAANGCIRSPGGAGGGGSGGISGDTAGENGEDGLGGGGGGGLAKAASGRGGSGIVAVRYVVWTSSVPLLRESTAEAKGGSFVTVAGALGAFAAGESSATVKMRYWKTSDASATSVATVLALSGDDALDTAFEKTVGGFETDTEYGYALYAEGANGASTEFTGTFATFSESIGSAASGGTASVVDSIDRVHVFTEDGTFTATGSGYAEILVVGGGGAGGTGAGPGGGGGGGGVVHATKVLIEPGAYTVTVGAGGTMNGTAATAIVSAGDSSLALASGPAGFSFETITAYGGGNGIGWDANNNATSIAKASGGSGGGGARNVQGTQGGAIYGQGHLGGNVGSNNRPGGGGGAGTKGANGSASGVTPSGAGAGGAGLAFSITGTRVVYGSGGGGGASDKADAMASGGENGGDGAYWTVAATAGVDGTGGGGGGGCKASTATQQAGAGGSGVVVIRYTDFSLAGDAPVLSVHDGEATIGCNSILLPLDVTSAGAGASTVTLTATWRHAGEASDLGSLTLPDFIGDAVLDIPVSPGRAYAVTVSIDNGQAGGTAEWTGTFDSAPMFSEALAYTATGKLGYTVDGAATADSQRLELWVGADENSMTNQATYTDASLLAAGAHTIQPFATEQFGETLSILLRHIAVVGSLAFTNETAVLSTTIADGATYMWRSDVPDGFWCDAANWTASPAGGRGWPTAGSTAKFPNAVVTCRVDRAVSIVKIEFIASGKITLLGTASGAGITATTAFTWGNNGTYVFDGLAFNSGNQAIRGAQGATVRFQNGSTVTCSSLGGDAGSTSSHAVIEVLSSTVNAGNTSTRNLDLVLEAATLNISAWDLGTADNNHGTHVRILDAATRIVDAAGFNATKDSSVKPTITLELSSAGGYSTTDALIRETGTNSRFMDKTYPLIVECPETTGSKTLGKCDILVADWTKKSINTDLVEFGEVDREGSYFSYTEGSSPLPKTVRRKSAAEVAAAGETAKYLWYHHAPPSATVIIVK